MFSDSAAAHKSSSVLSDSPSPSDSARAHKSAHLASDSPAVHDSASSSNMLRGSLSDTASISDSARSYQSAVRTSDSPTTSDSTSLAEMLVTGSSDTAVFSDSARSYLSGASPSDSPALADSASYNNMLVQGLSDAASVSDSARSYKSGASPSDSPDLSDSTAGLGALASSYADAAAVSDSARVYKSGLAPQSLPALSDQLRWGSVRVAGAQDSPVSSDSARAYQSSATTEDAPVHYSSARAGKTTAIEHDAPRFSDASFIGRPPEVAGDLPDVRDGVSFYVGDLFELDGEDLDADVGATDPALHDTIGSDIEPPDGGSGEPELPRRGSGSVGVATVSVHGASWDACSQDPHVLVVAGPDCGNVTVTISQQGGLSAARPTGDTGAPPDSCVWRAPVNPDVQEVQIRAIHGRTATSDERTLAMDSCSGWVPFTPFAVQAGPPAVSAPAVSEPNLAAPALEDSRAAVPDLTSQVTLEGSEVAAPKPDPLTDARNSPEISPSLVEEPATIRTVPPTGQPVLDVEPTGAPAAPAILPEREPGTLVWAVVAAALATVIGLVAFRSRRAARS